MAGELWGLGRDPIGVLEGVVQVDHEGVVEQREQLLLHRDLLPPRLPREERERGEGRGEERDARVWAVRRPPGPRRVANAYRAEVVLHRFLLHHLHRVSHAAVALHHLDHLAEAALAEDAHHLEVGERRLDVLLRLELEDVLELHRAEELLERRRVELGEHARLDRQEDLAQLALLRRRVGGVRVGVEHPLETLVHVVDHVVVEVAEERLRRALGDVLGGEALRLGLDRVEVGEVLVLLARRVEVERLQQLGGESISMCTDREEVSKKAIIGGRKRAKRDT